MEVLLGAAVREVAFIGRIVRNGGKRYLEVWGAPANQKGKKRVPKEVAKAKS